MKKTSRILSIAVASAMLLSLTACGGNAGPGASSAGGTTGTDSKTDNKGGDAVTTISWYYPGDMTDHVTKVWDEINKYSTEKIGVVVEPHVIPWGDYPTKTTTVMTSGDDFDIMFGSATYFSSVATGAAQPIDEFLKTVGKETYDALPASLWLAATVNGHIYGVPTYKDNAACPGLIYNMDMTTDLGITMPKEFSSMADLSDLFYEVKAKKDEKYPADKNIPLFKGINLINTAEENICDTFAVANIPGIDSYAGIPEGKVFNQYKTPEAMERYKLMRKWVEDGIFATDAPNYDPENSVRNSGKIFCDSPLGYVSFPENGWDENVKTGFIPSTWKYMTTDYAMFGSNIIGAKSKNPEKAVAFLNLVNTDNFVANTIRFGVEGEYYTKTADNKLDFTTGLNSDPANRAYYQWYGWQFGNLFAMSLPAQESPTLWDDLKAANESAHVSANMGFVFDRTPVQNEIASCTSVKTEYEDNLKNGMLKDVEKSMAEYNAKLDASGIEKIIAEAQKQLDAWRASNK